jgi:structural maintenance of chromosome 2
MVGSVANVGQIIQAVEEMKANVKQLKEDIQNAKARHGEALKDIKRIEKDMSDFNDNKDDKLAELQSTLNTLKKNLAKDSTSVKTLQKELQAARLEAEQASADLGASQEQLLEVDSTLEGQETEIQALQQEQAQAKVTTKLACRGFDRLG